jgi:NAD(P)-dependent dehydrogenase (short-subunit alcohol dehydrogenase family)
MESTRRQEDGEPIFDDFNIDLVVQVMANTVFSPFFIFFIPIFYLFQGNGRHDPMVIYPGIYLILISSFWFFKWYSKLHRNQGKLLWGPAPLDWSEQIVIITGGSSGIGELLANTLAARSVSVVVLDINPIQTENYNISYYKCDVSKWEEVEAVSKRVIEEIGEPTMIVNNAGVIQGKLLVDLTPNDINQTFGVNTLAHFWILKAFLPSLLKQKQGHIVTVSSAMGLTGVSAMSDYCASKHALFGLHESLRAELDFKYKCPKIRTTLVTPGHILTPMFKTIKFPEYRMFSFLAPSVHPVTVVKQIVAALDEQYSQTVVLPFYVHFIPFANLLPSFVQDVCRWATGADQAMDQFTKITARRADEGPLPSEIPTGKDKST